MPKDRTYTLPKAYAPAPVEQRWYAEWESKGYFTASVESTRPPFCIVIPPPNITGSLHMGHALNNTLQDILTRYKRMDGYNTLWLPGTDHASIAVHWIIDQQLAKEGKSRFDLGREEFLKKVRKWREQSGSTILHQLKRLGASCDWSRERFTLDPGLSRAVREVFCRLYEEGLIYRGDYIIHWCPRCHTALSDLEVEYVETEGNLYTIRYPIAGEKESLRIATTRPETMLGDTGVAVHPKDPRYKRYVGKKAILPIVGRELPIVADDHIDPEFGTGVLKVTPAHDANDFEIGQRHHLKILNTFTEDAHLTNVPDPFDGMERFAARKAVIQKLEEEGLLEKIEKYRHNVGHCYRCKTVIEPFVSKQWFVKIQPLAKRAIEAVEKGETKIIPKVWDKTYFEWMYHIRDWCISRQLWWGHRIPAWYCRHCNATMVRREDPTECSQCRSREIEQDPDILDTWFSSALWPFSTLGWPDKTPELKTFYPTQVLITGFDILFFWVARMIMMGLHFMGEVPFQDVYIHALVRDPEGQKMSKSKGNVIDPLQMIDQYGCDAFRFTLAAFAAQGRDIKMSEERIAGYRNFANKIWNAARFIFSYIETDSLKSSEPKLLPNQWILSRLHSVIQRTRKAIDHYHFNEAASTIYQFIWHEYCDWYLEVSKALISDPTSAQETKEVLATSFEIILRLLHPFMPFLTEELWQKLPHEADSIMIAPYPKETDCKKNIPAEEAFDWVLKIVGAIRNIRSENSVPPGKKIEAWIFCANASTLQKIQPLENLLKPLAQLNKILWNPDTLEMATAAQVVQEVEIHIPLKNLVDPKEEKRRLDKEIRKLSTEIERIEKKLSNKSFLERAPEEVVKMEKEKVTSFQQKKEKLEANLSQIIQLL